MRSIVRWYIYMIFSPKIIIKIKKFENFIITKEHDFCELLTYNKQNYFQKL